MTPALASVIKECHVLHEVKYILDILQNRKVLKYVRINVAGVMRGSGPFARMTKNPGMAGLPDILIWLAFGPVLCIEVKRPIGGKLSAAQKRFGEEIQGAGHIYEVVMGAKQLLEILSRYGVTI